MSRFFESCYLRLVIQRPWWVIGAIAILLVVLCFGLPKVKLDASADSLTLEHDQSIDYYREIYKRYQTGDFLFITFKPNKDLFSDESLAQLKSLRDELLKINGIAGANTILDVPLLYSPQQTLKQIKAGTRTLLMPGVNREEAQEEFLTSPIYRNMLLGPDRQTTVIQLNFVVDNHYIDLVRHRDALRLQRSKGTLSAEGARELKAVSTEFREYRTEAERESRARVEQVRETVKHYQSDAEIFVGGAAMITADMVSFIRSDLVVFGSAILVFIIIMLSIIFRQPRFVFVPFLVCALSVVMMLGLLGWLDWRLTVISSNFVALLLIVTLALTIHLVVRYREFHGKNPVWSQAQLVESMVKAMFLPCLYTLLTTIVAFASLVVSDIRPVIDFGWMMSIGLCLSFILTFLLLPACLRVLPLSEPAVDKQDESIAFTLRFSRITERYGNWVLIVSVIAAIVSVVGISRLEVENRFIDYFHKSTEIYQGMKVIDQRLGGTTTLDIIVDVDPALEAKVNSIDAGGSADPFAEADPFDEPDPFETPEPLAEEDPFAEADPFSEETAQSQQPSYWFTVAGLKQIEKLHDYVDALPEVGKVLSLATAYKVAKDINGGPLNDFELAILRNSLPVDVTDFLIKPYLSSEKNQTRVTMRVIDTYPGLKRGELVERIKHHAIADLGFSESQIHTTGNLVLYNNMLQSLFQSQIVTLGAVFIGIMIMFMVLFRSILLAIIAIVPNMLAAGVVLGGMGLAGITLDMMTITIAAITVGIGVDDTIHYIHRFQEEFAVDRNYVAAMHRAHASIGKAMYYTSVTIIVGFSVLALSKFIPSIYFGLLTGVAMLAAILGALMLLPKLILLIKPMGKEGPVS